MLYTAQHSTALSFYGEIHSAALHFVQIHLDSPALS